MLHVYDFGLTVFGAVADIIFVRFFVNQYQNSSKTGMTMWNGEQTERCGEMNMEHSPHRVTYQLPDVEDISAGSRDLTSSSYSDETPDFHYHCLLSGDELVETKAKMHIPMIPPAQSAKGVDRVRSNSFLSFESGTSSTEYYSSEDVPEEIDDPILKENADRFVMFPVVDNQIWEFYKKQVSSFWTVEEVDMSRDVEDWKKLKPQERYFLKNVLAFFAASDGIIVENLSSRFMNDVQMPEVRAFYGFQTAMENIHSEMYSLLIDTLVDDKKERDKLFHATVHVKSVKKKAEWAQRWITSDSSFARRLVAFSAVEGIFFSGSFCAIFWMKKRGLMPGLCFSNELISRDEGLHTDFACLLYSKLKTKLHPREVQAIISLAVECEQEFICESLSVSLVGMNAELMGDYIRFVADRLLVSLGVEKIYHVENPFEWMEMISLTGKTNFFEKRVGDYQKAGVMASLGGNTFANHTFSTEEEF